MLKEPESPDLNYYDSGKSESTESTAVKAIRITSEATAGLLSVSAIIYRLVGVMTEVEGRTADIRTAIGIGAAGAILLIGETTAGLIKKKKK